MLAWAGTLIVRRAAAGALARSSLTLEQLEQACAADPGRASCWARLAEARETLGEDAAAVWQKAIAADPRNAAALTQAALAAESRGDPKTAERLLLQASEYNQLWLPRWTLAGFYYRQRRPEFWTSARAALERSWDDPTAVFRLCRDNGAGAQYMLDHVLPQTPAMLKAYVWFLIREGGVGDLPAAAERYARQSSVLERVNVTNALIAAADALIHAGRTQPALDLWNYLAGAGYIPYPAWSAESPLVNGRFHPPLATPAFDWRTPNTEEVTANFGTPLDGVKIGLTGRQPENAGILAQFVVLQPGLRYRFSFDYRTPGIGDDDSALYWSILDTRTQALASSTWEHVSVRFEAPAGSEPQLTELVLVAGRKHGRARMQGEAWVRHVRLESY